jgi:hypothetical protein
LHATIAPTHIIAHVLCSSKNPDYTIKQNTARPYRPKGTRKYTTQLGGGGDGGKDPHPHQVKSCHVMPPIIAFVRQLPFNKS